MLPFILSNIALAQSYTVDLDVPDAVPVGTTSDHVIVAGLHFPGVAAGYADTTVPSSWSHLECHVEDGDVTVLFSATASTFPSTVPSTATCASGGYSLTVNLHEVPFPPYEDLTFTPSVGLTIDLTPPPGFSNLQRMSVHPLPVGPSYQEGSWQARLSPSIPWPGVQCTMEDRPSSGPQLIVRVKHDAPVDEGYCVIQSTAGVDHAIPLEILR